MANLPSIYGYSLDDFILHPGEVLFSHLLGELLFRIIVRVTLVNERVLGWAFVLFSANTDYANWRIPLFTEQE